MSLSWQVQAQPLMVQVSGGQLITSSGQPIMVQAMPGGQGQTIMQVPVSGAQSLQQVRLVVPLSTPQTHTHTHSFVAVSLTFWFLGSHHRCLTYIVDPAGAAWADSAAGRADVAVAGPAGSGSTDHHSAATGCHHCRPEPGEAHAHAVLRK